MAKFLVTEGFRITVEMLALYRQMAVEARRNVTPGMLKPPADPIWLTVGAVYRAGDEIEITEIEYVELRLIMPLGALEQIDEDYLAQRAPVDKAHKKAVAELDAQHAAQRSALEEKYNQERELIDPARTGGAK